MTTRNGWPRRWQRGAWLVSTDRSLLDLDVIHGFLARSYWSPGISRSRVAAALAGSRCYGLYGRSGRQAGLVRVITDGATFAYLADVFVLEEHRGGGLGTWLVECAVSDPETADLRRWMLFTADAHGLYRKFGFAGLDQPERAMIRPGPIG